jgi:S-adenosylmethionine decarboxylase
MMHAPAGLHVLFEIDRAPPDRLDDPDRLSVVFEQACRGAGATVRGRYIERFEPSGVSLLLVLSESHASAHTYPAAGVAMCDVFTCGRPDAEAIARAIHAGIGGRLHLRSVVRRGFEPPTFRAKLV